MALLCVGPFAQAAGDKQHYPGVFLGATNFKSETDFTLGVEYEYKFQEHWGLGGVYERTKEGHKGDGVNVWVASLYYHPNDSWRLGAGLGQEKIGGAHPHTEDLYRISAVYEVKYNKFIIAPTLAVDFIDREEAIVFGVAILFPF